MTPTPSQDEPLLDAAALAELRDMLGDALAEIAGDFLLGLQAEVDRIVAAQQSAPELRRAAHSLKGSAGNMGARALAALAADVEACAARDDVAAAQLVLPALLATAQTTRTALQQHLGLA